MLVSSCVCMCVCECASVHECVAMCESVGMCLYEYIHDLCACVTLDAYECIYV